MLPRGSARWLLLIVLAGLVLRLAYVATLPSELTPDNPDWYDGGEYLRLARGLLEHGAYLDAKGQPTAYWPPGYPLFLAVAGGKIFAVRALQAILGALTALLAYGIARGFLGRRASLFAAAVTAVYPLYLYGAGSLHPVALKSFLVAAVFFLLIRAREKGGSPAPLVAGLLGAWLALCSASFLPGLLLAGLWLILDRAEAPRSQRVKMLLLFLLPFLVILGGWTLRNHRELGRAAPVSLNGGYNFWLGNYPGVTAGTGNRWSEEMQAEYHALAEASGGEGQLDRALYARGMNYVKDDPGRFLGLSFMKALNLWRLWPRPMTEDHPGLSLKQIISICSYGIILPFALVFLFTTLRRRPASRLALLLFLGLTAVHAASLSKFRFRLPVDTLLIVLGTGGVAALLRLTGIRWLEDGDR